MATPVGSLFQLLQEFIQCDRSRGQSYLVIWHSGGVATNGGLQLHNGFIQLDLSYCQHIFGFDKIALCAIQPGDGRPGGVVFGLYYLALFKDPLQALAVEFQLPGSVKDIFPGIADFVYHLQKFRQQGILFNTFQCVKLAQQIIIGKTFE